MRKVLSTLAISVALAAVMAPALATTGHTLNVDGVVYTPYKVVGGGETAHYNTPDTNPQSAFSERHQWVGNGSEHLPCPYGIHWIDNKNVLTISHCLEGPDETTTTTSTPETTTTSSTLPETTTTSSTLPQTTTTSSIPETTTTSSTVPETTTTEPPSTTTEPPTTTVPEECVDDPNTSEDECELPMTGVPLELFGAAGVAALVLGGLALRASRLNA